MGWQDSLVAQVLVHKPGDLSLCASSPLPASVKVEKTNSIELSSDPCGMCSHINMEILKQRRLYTSSHSFQ